MIPSLFFLASFFLALLFHLPVSADPESGPGLEAYYSTTGGNHAVEAVVSGASPDRFRALFRIELDGRVTSSGDNYTHPSFTATYGDLTPGNHYVVRIRVTGKSGSAPFDLDGCFALTAADPATDTNKRQLSASDCQSPADPGSGTGENGGSGDPGSGGNGDSENTDGTEPIPADSEQTPADRNTSSAEKGDAPRKEASRPAPENEQQPPRPEKNPETRRPDAKPSGETASPTVDPVVGTTEAFHSPSPHHPSTSPYTSDPAFWRGIAALAIIIGLMAWRGVKIFL